VSSEELHLWDLDTQTLVNKYRGQKQKDNVIRSTFGGYNQAFVVSGSEGKICHNQSYHNSRAYDLTSGNSDNHVYVWNRKHGSLLQVLEGHNAMVNSVSWNPTNPNLFASASDDKTVRM
jgi:WD40 repeat protein